MLNAPDRCLPVAYSPTSSAEEFEDVSSLLKAIAEPMRLTILDIMVAAKGELVCACVFPDALGVSQPTASHHLKKLVDVGLLEREQYGKWAYFRLVPAAAEPARNVINILAGRAPVTT